jgi:hypothetical protein
MPIIKMQRQPPRHRLAPCQRGADAPGRGQERCVSVACRIGAALALTVVGAAALASVAQASPLLRCEFEHAGQRQVKDFAPVAEPYGVRALTLEDDFRFKAVLMADAQGVQYVNLYTYYLHASEAVLLHQAKYLSPGVAPAYTPGSLTGVQTMHSPQIGLQLQYHCSLFEAAP